MDLDVSKRCYTALEMMVDQPTITTSDWCEWKLVSQEVQSWTSTFVSLQAGIDLGMGVVELLGFLENYKGYKERS